MNQTELNSAIQSAFDNLSNLNEQLYDYWYSQLHDDEDNKIIEEWTAENLKLMETDVMYQSQYDAEEYFDCDDSDDGYALASAGFGTDEDY